MKTNIQSASTILGMITLAGFAGHAAFYAYTGELELIVWICHASALLAGVGLLMRSPRVNAVGMFGLAVGFPTWLLYLIGGGEFIPTSVLTHVLGFVLSVWGARLLGVPRSTWVLGTAYVAAMMILARLLTSPEANVNLAFGPDPTLSLWTYQGPAHWALLLGQWTLAFGALQFVLTQLLGWEVPGQTNDTPQEIASRPSGSE